MAEVNHALQNAQGHLDNIRELVAKLDSTDDEKRESALEEMYETPLSVLVRSPWYAPTSSDAVGPPAEYEILLTTGGPALRIIGELDESGQVLSAEMQWQDWGTPWTRYALPMGESDRVALVTFASQFCFV